jgi:hypothetical protein
MKRYLVIPLALLALILFSGKSCNDVSERKRHQQEEEATRKEIEAIRSEFGAEYLDGDLRFAFARKAVQKLRDYADYANIANDTALDSLFRIQARTMMNDLFLEGLVPQILLNRTGHIRISSIRVAEPLQPVTNTNYKGILEFRMEVRAEWPGDTVLTRSPAGLIEMIAVKTTRTVGTGNLDIWKVFLGEYTDNRLSRIR